MDTQTLLAIAGVACMVASALTNLLPTPTADAPAWWRWLYRAIELLALVGRRTKDNPAAAAEVVAAYWSIQDANYATAAKHADAAYRALKGPSAHPGD